MVPVLLRVGFGVAAYCYAMATLVYASVWATNANVHIPALQKFVHSSIDGKAFWDLHLPIPAAAFWNFAVFYCTFAFQHNTMARSRVKRQMRKVVPFAWERSLFVAAAATCLGIVMHCWQPITLTVWRVGAPLAMVIYAISAISYLLFVASTFAVDHFELMGLKQSWMGLDENSYPRARFVCNAFYWFVRHPLYLAFLTYNFATPHMTLGRLVFCLTFLAFVLWSIPLEEQEIVEEVGEAYLHYRAHVPALLPRSLMRYRPPPTNTKQPACSKPAMVADGNGGTEALAEAAAVGDASACISLSSSGCKKVL